MKKKYPIFRELEAKRRMSRASFWSEAGTRAVSFLCAVIVMVIILCVVVPADTQRLNDICILASIGLGIVWAIPFIRFTRMRLRDTGRSPRAYFWLALPVIGWVVFAGLMCAKGTPQSPESNVEVL